jgi:DNA-binding beta-propeller fold protein YncE
MEQSGLSQAQPSLCPITVPRGDGGQATDAVLLLPVAVAVDSLGNLYIADSLLQDIRKVGLDGVISTFLGISDNKVNPNLAFGPDGSLYLSATTVNELLPTGEFVPVAGNGFYYPPPNCVGFPGMGAPICPPLPIPPPLGDGGPATQATIFPAGIAVDSASSLYIADTQGRIREVFSSSGIIITIEYPGRPTAVALDTEGNLYIADFGQFQVAKVSTDGAITTIAGSGSQGHSGDGGLAVNAQLLGPTGLVVDPDGNVYVSDTDSIRLLKPVTADRPVAGASAIPASMHLPARTEAERQCDSSPN